MRQIFSCFYLLIFNRIFISIKLFDPRGEQLLYRLSAVLFGELKNISSILILPLLKVFFAEP